MKLSRSFKAAWALTALCVCAALAPIFYSGAKSFATELPSSIEYQKQSDEQISEGTYAIVSCDNGGGSGAERILHHSNEVASLDRCGASKVGDTLEPTDCEVSGYAGTGAHDWTITPVEGGYTIQSHTDDGAYLNISESSACAESTLQILTIEKTEDGFYNISDGEGNYLVYIASGWSVSTEAYSLYLYKQTSVEGELADDEPESGTTVGQPFSSGTGGSDNFRIPSLITLNDGSLLAAIDARWNHSGDAAGLDTIISKSSDGGATWNYSFPNYFNDSTNAKNTYATAFIDPVMVQDANGTIYLMVDLWPGGVALNTAAYTNPVASSGYELIDGAYRLVLYGSPIPSNQTSSTYTHYVGDFESSGYAPVYACGVSGEAVYYVDKWYYLYDVEKEPLYCQQLGSSKYVAQNVFFFNADLHVTATSYLWLITSDDGGSTWSAPLMLNEQVRTGLSSNQNFYGVGPGRGLITSTGRIVFPCYTYIYGVGDGNTSVVYSDDGGISWKRSANVASQSSEATLVEVEVNGTQVLYMFARHGIAAISNDDGETWTEKTGLLPSDITDSCQIDAIVYSKTIDGKQAILLSCPTGGSRSAGKVYVGLVQDDGAISWDYSYSVTSGSYAYSCLTELDDASIGLLYEGSTVIYTSIDIEDIAKGAVIDGKRSLQVPLYGSYTETVSSGFAGFEDIDASILEIVVVDNNDGTYTVTYTGKKEGTVSFTETVSGYEYTVAVTAENLVEIGVEVGESTSIEVLEGSFSREPDSGIAKAEINTQLASDLFGECVGSRGIDASYSADAVALSSALYTFKAEGSNWIISAATEEGTTLYLNITDGGGAGYPHGTTSHSIAISGGTASEGSFTLQDQISGAGGKTLYFWRDGKNYFDRQAGTATNGATDFLLYRPIEGDEVPSEEIPGYVQVASLDDIQDGAAYLIVAHYDGIYYALYPSSDTGNRYSQAVKVDPQRVIITLDIRGVAIGVTDAKVGDSVYRITVNGYEDPSFDWASDYLSATATFTHSGDKESVTLPCTISAERVEPTADADGTATYTATVEFGGKTYTDVKTVVLPATGEGNDNSGDGEGSGGDGSGGEGSDNAGGSGSGGDGSGSNDDGSGNDNSNGNGNNAEEGNGSGANADKPSGSVSAQTGDEVRLGLVCAIALLAACALAISTAVYLKRRKGSPKA